MFMGRKPTYANDFIISSCLTIKVYNTVHLLYLAATDNVAKLERVPRVVGSLSLVMPSYAVVVTCTIIAAIDSGADNLSLITPPTNNLDMAHAVS